MRYNHKIYQVWTSSCILEYRGQGIGAATYVALLREVLSEQIVWSTTTKGRRFDMTNTKRISKKLSYHLRHQPGRLGITLDKGGWTDVDTMLAAFEQRNIQLTREELDNVVETNNKKRFEFNENKTKIRASQGHSVKVDLGYKPKKPPEFLYHGTHSKNVDSIMKGGLDKGNRHDVHLSSDIETAKIVAQRRGNKFVILKIKAKEMSQSLDFFCSTNGVFKSK